MNNSKLLATIAIAVAVIFGLLIVTGKLTFKDDRTRSDRLGDAIHALPNGPDKAADQLGDRSTGQRIGDQIHDIGK
jgi:hypothetical protein